MYRKSKETLQYLEEQSYKRSNGDGGRDARDEATQPAIQRHTLRDECAVR